MPKQGSEIRASVVTCSLFPGLVPSNSMDASSTAYSQSVSMLPESRERQSVVGAFRVILFGFLPGI